MAPPAPSANTIGATFAAQFYNDMVSSPERLSSYYTENASLSYDGAAARGAQSLPVMLQRLTAKVDKLCGVVVREMTANVTARGVAVDVSGHFVSKGQTEVPFQQQFELEEGSSLTYAICKDTLRLQLQPEKLNWAETPPMFQSSALPPPGTEPLPTTTTKTVPSTSAAPPTDYAAALRMGAQSAPPKPVVVRGGPGVGKAVETKVEKQNKPETAGQKGKRPPPKIKAEASFNPPQKLRADQHPKEKKIHNNNNNTRNKQSQ